MNEAAETGMVSMIAVVIYFLITLTYIVGYWKIHTKAGQPGWAIFIPIYNVVVMLEICRRPLWWLLLLLVPVVNLFVGLVLILDLARVFNKGIGVAIGLLFLPCIFYPIIGFGEAEYIG